MMLVLESDFLFAKFTTTGATLTHLVVKALNIDIVAGFDAEEDYLTKNSPYFGSTIGRVCNRYYNLQQTFIAELKMENLHWMVKNTHSTRITARIHCMVESTDSISVHSE